MVLDWFQPVVEKELTSLQLSICHFRFVNEHETSCTELRSIIPSQPKRMSFSCLAKESLYNSFQILIFIFKALRDSDRFL